MTPVRAELADLVAYALFDVDPRVRDANRPLHFFMVSIALYEVQGSLTSDELHAAVCEQLVLDNGISIADVNAAVRVGLDTGLIVQTVEGGFCLGAVRRVQLDEARQRIEQQRASFYSHILDAVIESGASGVQEDLLQQELEQGLQSLLGEQSTAVAAAYGPDGIGLDSALASLNVRDRLREVASALAPGGAQPNKLQREVLHAGLEHGLRTLPPDARAYLASLYHRTVASALLSQDPGIRRVKHQLASQRVAYLDANVLMAWMFPADPLHDLATQAIELTGAVGAELRVTSYALEELGAQIKEADRFMRRYRGEGRLLNYADDVVVRSFRIAQRDHPGLTWAAFIGMYEPPTAWIEHHGLVVEAGVDLNADARLGAIEAAVRRRRPNAASVVVNTDACNVLHVLRARAGLPADAMGSRAWLLTNDGSLAVAERDLAAAGDLPGPVSRMAQAWCDLLGPCVPPDAERLAGYVTRLVQSQFGLLAVDPTFVDKAFLAALARSRFKIADVLTDERLAGQVLARLQADDDLNALLGEVDVDTDEWNDRLAAAVQRTLETMQVSSVDEAELLAARAAQAKAQAAAEEERKSRLETVRQNAELKKVAEDAAERASQAEAKLARHAQQGFFARLFGRKPS
ncbi:MAG: hypothetical protein JWQ20_1938 [Conexibacter sp.]|nr:hypothetical protein [Conexibacter sp.]